MIEEAVGNASPIKLTLKIMAVVSLPSPSDMPAGLTSIATVGSKVTPVMVKVRSLVLVPPLPSLMVYDTVCVAASPWLR